MNDETTMSPTVSGRGETSADPALLRELRAVGITEPLLERLDDPTQLRFRYGVAIWWTHHYGDCDFDELYAHSHDRRRVLAAVSGMIRDNRVDYHEVRVAETGWCRLVTECGCTAEQHAAEHDGGMACEPACRFPALPPCGGPDAPYAWQLDPVPAAAPGAVPFTRVALS